MELKSKIKSNVKTSDKKLRWWHTFHIVTPKCPECNGPMEWETVIPGYDFVLCEKCQIIRD